MDLKLLLVILIGVGFFLIFVAQTQAEFGNNLSFLQEASVAVRQTCGFQFGPDFCVVAQRLFRSSLWE